MKEKIKVKIKDYLIILVFTLIVSIPLINSDFDIYRDDGIQHVARLMGTYQSITEDGQVFPVIMSNFCNGFGYSWNIFYSPFTAYIPMIFKIFTNSYELILKIFIGLISFLSGIAMYEFTTKVTKNRYAGLLASALYIFVPYRLTDMYMRVAIAELASFIFIPITFQGVYNIFNSEEKNIKKSLILTLGAVGLITTHIVIAMYIAIFCLIYLVINIKKLKDKTVLKMLGINILLIILLSSFYILPMLEHRLNTEYEVFKEGRMESTEKLINNKTDLTDLIYTEDGQLIREIGFVTIVGLILTFIAYKKIDKNNKMIYWFSLIMGIICIFVSLRIFPFEKMPSILKMIQFTFRLLEFSSFFFVFIIAVNYSAVIKDFQMKDVIVLSTICILLVIPYVRRIDFKKDWEESDLWPSVAVTDYTGRVHAGCATFEYLPSKAFENLDYIKHRENTIYILNGYANIEYENKSGSEMEFYVSEIKDNTILELPYIYYLGYDVICQNEKGEEKIDVSESENGFIQINLQEENTGKIIVKYTGTLLMKISYIISFITLIAIIVILIYLKVRDKKIPNESINNYKRIC